MNLRYGGVATTGTIPVGPVHLFSTREDWVILFCLAMRHKLIGPELQEKNREGGGPC